MSQSRPVPVPLAAAMPYKASSLHPRRALRMALGGALVLFGAITTPTPVPVGLALLAAGVAVLAVESRLARRLLHGLRRRYPGLSARLRDAGRHLPARMRRVLERTDPWRR